MCNRSWFLLLAGVLVALGSGNVWAVDPASDARTLTTNELIYKSTELGDLRVYNASNTDTKLGHLNDLIINAHTGQVFYGILDTGILGKNFIVPWRAFQIQQDANHKSWLVLAKTSEELKNAPVFEKNKQPDFASSQWRDQVDNFFGVQTGARPADSGQLTANDMMFRSAELQKLNVINRTDPNAKLGHLSDLIVNAHTGRVLYGILDTGIGGKYIPVPWNVFQLRQDGNNRSSLVLNKTSDELKNAPSFDMKMMPDFTSEQWTASVDRFFGVRTVARPTE